MKVAVINTSDKTFLAANGRWYLLQRKQRRAPVPMIFPSKTKVAKEGGLPVKYTIGKDFTELKFVRPEKVKPKEPRQVSIRTCGGRSSR